VFFVVVNYVPLLKKDYNFIDLVLVKWTSLLSVLSQSFMFFVYLVMREVSLILSLINLPIFMAGYLAFTTIIVFIYPFFYIFTSLINVIINSFKFVYYKYYKER
jgi:hypothetical protein